MSALQVQPSGWISGTFWSLKSSVLNGALVAWFLSSVQIGVGEDSKGRLLGGYFLRMNGGPDFAVHLNLTKGGLYCHKSYVLPSPCPGWVIFNQNNFPSLD